MLPAAVNKFLPNIGFTPKFDPYHTVRSDTTIVREVTKQDRAEHKNIPANALWYVATAKPEWETALIVTSTSFEDVFCYIGCFRCYHTVKVAGYWKFNNERPLLNPSPEKQFTWLVESLNTTHQHITDGLISGGEPLILNDKQINQVLSILARAKNIRTVRFCTGTLFLGTPFRFTDALLSLCRRWIDDTGKMIPGFNCHIAHPENFTPEAVYFADKIRGYGFDIMPQLPLEEGVSFWPNDLEKTKQCLARITDLSQYLTGSRFYYMIPDMESSVPLESILHVMSELFETHHRTNLKRPTAVALFEERNIPLSFHTL